MLNNTTTLGELLRAKLDQAVESNVPTPANMPVQQVLDMAPFDVYMNILNHSWTIEDFTAWVYACESHAFRAGMEEGSL